MFFFFGWAAAGCHTVAKNQYSNKNLSSFHRSSSCEPHIVMDAAADWVIKRCSVNFSTFHIVLPSKTRRCVPSAVRVDW